MHSGWPYLEYPEHTCSCTVLHDFLYPVLHCFSFTLVHTGLLTVWHCWDGTAVQMASLTLKHCFFSSTEYLVEHTEMVSVLHLTSVLVEQMRWGTSEQEEVFTVLHTVSLPCRHCSPPSST